MMEPNIPKRDYEPKYIFGSNIVASFNGCGWRTPLTRPYINGETTKFAKILLNVYEKGYVDQDHYMIYGSKMYTPQIFNYDRKNLDDPIHLDGKPYLLRSGREIWTTLRSTEILSYDRKEKLWKPGFYLDRYVDWMCDNFPIQKPIRGNWKPGKRMPEHHHSFPSDGSEINLDWVLNYSHNKKIIPAVIDDKILMADGAGHYVLEKTAQNEWPNKTEAWFMDMSKISGKDFYDQLSWRGRILPKEAYDHYAKSDFVIFDNYDQYSKFNEERRMKWWKENGPGA